MTDPATELRDLVDQLARTHDVPVVQLGQRIGTRRQRPLLTLLAEATAPTITTGGRGGALESRLAFDPAASELHTTIRARIRRWADDAGVPKHWALAAPDPIDWRDAARLLTAWHARTLHTEPLRWIPTLAGWVAAITDLVADPPRRIAIDAPCPRCGQRWTLNADGDRTDTLQLLQRDGADSETTCRNCGATWNGLAGAEALQAELHAADHTTHGIACAGERPLGPLLELAVTIPTREPTYA